jgi:3-hydroxyacyl-[acyl-carrier-protein] dehydratase
MGRLSFIARVSYQPHHVAATMQALSFQPARDSYRIARFGGRKNRRRQRSNMLLDINDIQKVLPHRYPFLLIDGIEEMERWKRIVGIKNVTINESYFQGHFPGKPIMPGVLIIESMAQTGGFLLLQEVAEREKKLLYFVSIDNARFRRPVVPGDQLRVEMDVVAWREGLGFCKLHGKATVNGELAAEATLMCKMVDLETEMPSAKVPVEKAR